MQTLEELLEMEREIPPEHPDERIALTLYCCSLSRPMRSLDVMVSSSDMHETCLIKMIGCLLKMRMKQQIHMS